MNKERIVLITTLIIFVAVTGFALWDLYGKNPDRTTTKQLTNTGNKPPEAAIAACTNKAAGDMCEFKDKDQTAQGKCDVKPGVLACAPDKKEDSGATPSGQPKNTSTTTQTTLPTAASSCINNTKDTPQCKDCCDCLNGADSTTRTSCRNTCATHDFTTNSSFITITSPSVLGKNGDYTSALTQTTANACKVYCENSMSLKCGDYQHCRMACDNKWGIKPGPSGQTSGTTQAN